MKPEDASPPQLQIDNQVCFPLYSAANAVTRAYRPLLSKLDLTYLQYIVMMVLWQERRLNVKELGKRLRLDSGTLTPLLKRLESKELLERRRSDKDERVRIITISQKGMELRNQACDIPEQLSCKVALSVEQLLNLKQLCEQLLSSLDS